MKNVTVSAWFLVAVFAGNVHAALITYDFDSTAVSQFGTGPYGTVTLQDKADDGTYGSHYVSFTVQLASGFEFVDTGSHNLFTFNSDLLGLTLGNQIQNLQLDIDNPGDITLELNATQSGFGDFTYGFNCPKSTHANPTSCATGASDPYGSLLTFDILGATANQFDLMNDEGFYFSADVFGNGMTGPIAVSGKNEVTVPEPSILALFLSGIAGLGFARRRKQRV